MQKLMGYIRKACQEFELIDEDDSIAVGVSGGKDSMVLLVGLAGMRRFYERKYTLSAVTLDPGFGGKQNDYDEVRRLCDSLDIPFKLIHTDIARIVFDVRKEDNPCSLCAKMRRGALHDAAKEMGCNKLALAHHKDDVVETFMMNLFKEGRLGCFAPKSYLSRKDITVIRPLVLVPEYYVNSCAGRFGLEIVKSACPADKNTLRQRMKDFLTAAERYDNGSKSRIFTALRKSGINGWK